MVRVRAGHSGGDGGRILPTCAVPVMPRVNPRHRAPEAGREEDELEV